jgi:ribonuclease BN (tRNA processing enzyme)
MGQKQDKKKDKLAAEAKGDRPKTSSLVYLQVLGLGTDIPDGIVPSVYLFMDQVRMIFNVGEGLQRYCVQHTVKLVKVEEIFLTRITTQTVGGLPVTPCERSLNASEHSLNASDCSLNASDCSLNASKFL